MTESFEASSSNPRHGREHFLPHTAPTLDDLLNEATWLEWRGHALPPSKVTRLVTTDQSRAEFVEGARLLRLTEDGRSVKPHQLLVPDMLEAGAETNALIKPRRSAKTTSALVVAVGRCSIRSGYMAAMTLATTGQKTTERFGLDVMAPIERRWPDPNTRPVKLYKSKGSEHVAWPTSSSSRFAALTPTGDAFRSSAYDFVLVDESGEATIEQGDDLNGAIYPSFDTRDDAQVLFAGTAGDYREGLLLWDALHDADAGVLAYMVDQNLAPDAYGTWDDVEPLVLEVHPGIAANLTSLEKVRARFSRLGPERFAREYLNLFGEHGAAVHLFDRQKWAATGTDEPLPAPPDRFGLAFAPHPDTGFTSIVAAWRTSSGKAAALLLDRVTLDRAAPTLQRLARKYRMPIVYDTASQNAAIVVERLNRLNPRPRLEPLNYGQVKQAATRVVDEVDRSNVLHWNAQADLTGSIHDSVKRRSGDRAWLIGRPPKAPETDVTAAEAWSYALHHYDTYRQKSTAKARVAT